MIKNDPEIAKIPVFMLTAKGQDADEQLTCSVAWRYERNLSARNHFSRW
jgi:hypothetical protein